MLAVKHGARSERLVGQLLPKTAAEIRQALEKTGAVPEGYFVRADDLAIDMCARALVRFRQVDSYMTDILDQDGKPHPSSRLWVSLWHAVNRSLAGLGLTPASRAEVLERLSIGSESVQRQAREAEAQLQQLYPLRRPKPVERDDQDADDAGATSDGSEP